MIIIYDDAHNEDKDDYDGLYPMSGHRLDHHEDDDNDDNDIQVFQLICTCMNQG